MSLSNQKHAHSVYGFTNEKYAQNLSWIYEIGTFTQSHNYGIVYE